MTHSIETVPVRRPARRLLRAAALSVFLCSLVYLSHFSAPVLASSWPQIALSSIGVYDKPVHITGAGDGSGRLFVVELTGKIWIVRNGARLSTPFLDASSLLDCGDGRKRLLSLAFPPGYTGLGHFYLKYLDKSCNIVIARFHTTSNPDIADLNSRQIVISQPVGEGLFGGPLYFGPYDGYLYATFGDGSVTDSEPGDRGQDPTTLLGKMLRIDVETGQPATYSIPATNPYANAPGYRAEIWALGFRNPWRFSFDRQNGDLYIGDVGSQQFEEVNFQPGNSSGGQNYGWKIMEAAQCFGGGNCNTNGLVLPVVQYDHSLGCSITGGSVYRGTSYPDLRGVYLYGDWCSGRIWGSRQTPTGWETAELAQAPIQIVTFGDDDDGNVYVGDYTGGGVYIIGASSTVPSPSVTFGVTPTGINPGQSATLSWTTSNATTVSIDQQIGQVAASGTRTVTPSVTTTYTLTATAAGGIPTTKTATVTVTPAAPPAPPGSDITLLGTPIALIVTPHGGGNKSLEVIRDGVFPAVGSSNSSQQYDTYTGDATRALDWIGYQFAAPHTFTGLTFQEGIQFADGGWFTSLTVQVRAGGTWLDVPNLVAAPAYAGQNGINFERFTLTFTPVSGDAIRLAGAPGGAARFISVGELRVSANDTTPSVSLALLAPNGGESWTVGTAQQIRWTATQVSTVTLEYRTSPAGAWLPIVQNVAAAGGSYAWTVPDAIAAQARVRITSSSTATVTDTSDNDFTIVAPVVVGAPPQDITAQATPIALVTAPRGGGSKNLDVLRDGVLPAVGSNNSQQQYDTYLGDATRTFDWIGYQFAAPHTFTALTFQEGIQFSDGGWFTSLGVQVRINGIWTDAPNLVSTPPYPGPNGINFERFALTFSPVVGDAIRLAGTPGGLARFISAGELRVMAADASSSPGSVTLLAPNGGESWTVGTAQTIRWSSSHLSAVTLEYRTSTAGTWTAIAQNLAAAGGSYVWTVPNAVSTQARVRVTDASNATVSDLGDGDFTIAAIASPTPPTASLSASPNPISQGQASTLSWTTANATTVSISPSVGVVPASGTQSVSPTATTIYTLTATGPGGVISPTTTVTVNAVSLPGVQDLTASGAPIALITTPRGGGSQSLEVVRDGVFPSAGSTNSLQQYDTYTGDPTRAFDWIGYQFAAPHTFTALTFQEGNQFSDGGWFATLTVQVRINGVWIDVPNLASTPPYPGANGITFERFALTFTPVTGDAIRLAGVPGGTARFVSVGELRVMANDSALPPAVTVLIPNGNEAWLAGSTQTIRWAASQVSAVTLEYRTSAGGAWTPIAQNVAAASGSYAWSVPDAATTQARIRLTDAASSTLADLSDGDFTIVAPAGTVTNPQDLTAQGTPIALITAPVGGGNKSLAVLRDSVFPAVGSTNSLQQYDTYTGDPTRGFDWVGYQFAAPHTFTGLTFQEGVQFYDGGWFATLTVQVRVSGVWIDAPNLASTPAYTGPNGISYERFALTFSPLVGDAIRVAGLPGGLNRFISVGELRVTGQ